jgi:hypothetical protein
MMLCTTNKSLRMAVTGPFCRATRPVSTKERSIKLYLPIRRSSGEREEVEASNPREEAYAMHDQDLPGQEVRKQAKKKAV